MIQINLKSENDLQIQFIDANGTDTWWTHLHIVVHFRCCHPSSSSNEQKFRKWKCIPLHFRYQTGGILINPSRFLTESNQILKESCQYLYRISKKIFQESQKSQKSQIILENPSRILKNLLKSLKIFQKISKILQESWRIFENS